MFKKAHLVPAITLMLGLIGGSFFTAATAVGGPSASTDAGAVVAELGRISSAVKELSRTVDNQRVSCECRCK